MPDSGAQDRHALVQGRPQRNQLETHRAGKRGALARLRTGVSGRCLSQPKRERRRMSRPAVRIVFEEDIRVYEPGEMLVGEYSLTAIPPSEVKAIELSV